MSPGASLKKQATRPAEPSANPGPTLGGGRFSGNCLYISRRERSPAPVRPGSPPLWAAVGAAGRLRHGGPWRDDAGDGAEWLGEEHPAALSGGSAGDGRRHDRVPGERHAARRGGTAATGGGHRSGPRLLLRAHGGGEP